jgi:hypothetical protein
MTLTGLQRYYLLQILPSDGAGSLRESRHAHAIRKQISMSVEQGEALKAAESDGTIPHAAIEDIIDPVEIDLSGEQKEVVAECFLRYEQQHEGAIPMNDAFVGLYAEFEPTIQEVQA